MNRILILFVASLITALPLSSQEQIQKTEVVEGLLAYTTIRSQVEFFHPTLLKRLEAFQEFLDPHTYASVRDAIENQYAAPKLLQEISRRCEPQLTLPQIISSLRWYESPVGSKISRSEHEAVLPANAKEFAAFREEEAQKHRSQRRRLLLERLESHSRTGMILDSTLATHFRTLLSHADPQIFGTPGTESVTLKRNIELLLGRLELRHRETLNVLPLFAYRRVTNDELQKYNEFYESADGVWLAGLITRELRIALENALVQAMRDFPSGRGKTQK